MRDSDKRSIILEKMKWWPWANNGVFVMDEEETRIVMEALEKVEHRKNYNHERYLKHQDEKKQQAKANYEKHKADVFKR